MKLHVETVGRGSHLTMLHGWGSNSAVWNGVRERLSARFTLQLVDLPGHGYSTQHNAATLDAVAQAVIESTEPGHLLGWSLGGQVAMAMALRAPTFVNKLVLVGTTPRFVEADDWLFGKKLVALEQFANELAADYAGTIRRFLALQNLRTPNARATVAALQVAVTTRGTPDATSLQAGLSLLRDNDLRTDARSVAQHTLIIQGARDALTSERAAHWLSQQLPHCRYALFADAAHAPFLSHDAAFVDQLTEFLTA